GADPLPRLAALREYSRRRVRRLVSIGSRRCEPPHSPDSARAIAETPALRPSNPNRKIARTRRGSCALRPMSYPTRWLFLQQLWLSEAFRPAGQCRMRTSPSSSNNPQDPNTREQNQDLWQSPAGNTRWLCGYSLG